MKLFSLKKTPFEPISHDPRLKKKVLAKNILPHVSTISHVVLLPGNNVSEHAHNNFYEVFFCLRGKSVFVINGENVTIETGHLLIVEPTELHAIPEIIEETEILYLHTAAEK